MPGFLPRGSIWFMLRYTGAFHAPPLFLHPHSLPDRYPSWLPYAPTPSIPPTLPSPPPRLQVLGGVQRGRDDAGIGRARLLDRDVVDGDWLPVKPPATELIPSPGMWNHLLQHK